MKFKKRMKPIVRFFDGIPYEAIEKFKTEHGAKVKTRSFELNGFLTKITFEPDPWERWFLWISNVRVGKVK